MRKVDKITQYIGRNFRSFGGGQKCFNNPIAETLKNQPLQFALGVDIKSVVKAVLKENKKLQKKRPSEARK